MSATHTTAAAYAAAPKILRMDKATASDWATVERWAASDGRNPGIDDADLTMIKYGDGFRVAQMDDRLASAFSLVRYDNTYAHLGNLLVAPDLRGTGYEAATLAQAIQLAADRTIGVDATPEQLDFFTRHGFEDTSRTIRYQGPASPHNRDSNVVPPLRHDRVQIGAVDAAAFPAPRHALAIGFAAVPGRHTLVYRSRSAIRGYGVLRPAYTGMHIGPVYADSEVVAAALLGALCGLADTQGAAVLTVDVPYASSIARDLVERYGLKYAGKTVRMHRRGRHAVPTAASSRSCYALTSLELG